MLSDGLCLSLLFYFLTLALPTNISYYICKPYASCTGVRQERYLSAAKAKANIFSFTQKMKNKTKQQQHQHSTHTHGRYVKAEPIFYRFFTQHWPRHDNLILAGSIPCTGRARFASSSSSPSRHNIIFAVVLHTISLSRGQPVLLFMARRFFGRFT